MESISENLSQGTFDILWDDLFQTNFQDNSQESIVAVKEMSSNEFMIEHGFDIDQLFTDMHEDPNPNQIITDKTSNTTETENVPMTTISTEPDKSESSIKMPAKQEFIEISSEEVRQIIQNEENKNTLKKTISDVAKFEQFLKRKQETKNIHEIEPDILDEYLANFILSIRKPDENHSKIFWNEIKNDLIMPFNYSLENDVNLQSQSLITLIPKPNKDLSRLSNWRPINKLVKCRL